MKAKMRDPESGYDPEALRRLNRTRVRTEAPANNSPDREVEAWTTNAAGEKRKVDHADGLLWLGEGFELRAGSRSAVSPMTWFSTGKVDLREASCVYSCLPVNDLPDDAGLGYWPEYSEMKPSQRGRYLRWLADGKRTHLDDIGYAFVYFYGLERRALVEGQDIPWIMGEVRRLLVQYPASRSFRKYLGGFLIYLYAANLGSPDMTEERLLDLHAFAPTPQKKTFPLLLGYYAMKGLPLSPDRAFYVLRHLPFPRSSPDAFPLRLKDLFCRRFLQVWPSGLTLSTSSRRCAVEYSVASGTLSFGIRGKCPPPVEIPNVLGKMGQFRKLREIWGTCLENEDGELVLVRRAGTRPPGEALPPRRRRSKTPPVAETPKNPEIVIDMDRVERLRMETDGVARKLAAVFGREDFIAPAETTDTPPPAPLEPAAVPSGLPFPDDALRNLDAKYAPVLKAVLERRSWAAKEWADLSRRRGFMPNALLEAINAWSEEELGDFLLLEENGVLILNGDVVNLP